MNPISACLIVRHDPHLARTIASIRPFVHEVCIFCDSPDDEEAAEAERLADRFERSFDLNGPNGRLVDWSKARNRAHALATQPWVLTIDSDDILEHGERLAELIAEYSGIDPVRIALPYDYQFDPMTLRCTRRQPRVRLVHHPEHFEWRKAAHEGWFAKAGVQVRDVYDLRVQVRHTKRDWTAALERATAIITAEAGPSGSEIADPRDRFDYGNMLAQNGDSEGAIRELTRYVEESGRNDEKAQACLRLAELTGSMADLVTPMQWAKRADAFAPDAFESAFKVAQLELLMAMTTGTVGCAKAAIEWCKQAIAAPLDSLVPYSPQDRDVAAYEVWNEAAKALGDEAEALHALEIGSSAALDEPGLLLKYGQTLGYMGPHADIGGRDIVFVLGNTTAPWNPISVDDTGHGGSELATIAMAHGLADKGHRVRVYVDCGRDGLYGGVEYLHPWHLNEDQDECDLLVAWRSARFLEALPARVKWLWTHDEHVVYPTPYRLSLADKILALTEWHARHLQSKHGKDLPANRIAVTRNGTEVDLFAGDGSEVRDPHRAVYCSAADRGLEFLLEWWPIVRREVPDARLEVFYGDAGLMAAEPRRAFQIRADIEDLKACGVTNHGRVSQSELAASMRTAGVWALPTRFRDTSNISAMTAIAAGLRVVTSRIAALPETIGDSGVLLDGDPSTDEYRDTFVRHVVEAMRRPEDGDRHRLMATARERFAWGPAVDQWDEWIREAFAAEEVAA